MESYVSLESICIIPVDDTVLEEIALLFYTIVSKAFVMVSFE